MVLKKGLLLFTGVLAVAAAACTGPSRPAEPGDEVAQPKYGGTFTYQVLNDPQDYDLSYVGNNTPGVWGLGLAYDSLLTIAHGPGVPYTEATFQPGLAERWETSEDGKTFTFHLRQGVKFANLPPLNGRDLTAADVKWTFEYLSRTGSLKELPRSAYAWMFEGLSSIETPDAGTVIVKFREPNPPFLLYAALTKTIPIVPHEIYDRDGHLRDDVLGSGPYQLDRGASQKGTRWVWRKNAGYWQEGKPYIDQVRWLVIPDRSAGWAAFKSGQLDLVGKNIAMGEAEQIRAERPEAVVFEVPEPTPELFYMNTGMPPLDKLEVRKAISLGIDRDELVNLFTRGKGEPGLAGAMHGWFTPEEVRRLVPYDPEQARKLLAGAGYAQGVNLELIFEGTTGGPEYVSELELLQSQLAKVGVAVTLKPLDKPTKMKKYNSKEFAVTVSSGGPTGAGDIDQVLYSNFHPRSTKNRTGVEDPKLEAMLDQEKRTVDPDKRVQLLREAIRYVNAEMYWGIGLYHGLRYQVWQPRLKNYAPNLWVNDFPITNSWLSK